MPIAQIPCCIIRGGTSKGIFIDEKHLPEVDSQRDKMLLSLFGSPDPRQVDGLGGADPLTSKVAIVSVSKRPGIDVEFLAADVGITEGVINYGNLCGNTASGVGHFALEQGLVDLVEPVTEVRIFCRNNNQLLIARLPTENGMLKVDGDFGIDGVPGTGAEILLDLREPGGAVTGRLLPTGRATDTLNVADKKISCSIVDSGILYAFLGANELGLSGCELPKVLDQQLHVRRLIEEVRTTVAATVNSQQIAGVDPISPKKVKVALVAAPSSYSTITGSNIGKESVDLVARIVNQQKVHKAFAVSGAICLATATAVEGTIPNRFFQPDSSPAVVRIGHPSGAMEAKLEYSTIGGEYRIHGAEVKRTARILMKGVAYAKV